MFKRGVIFLLLMSAVFAAEHPRLFFDEDDIPELQAKAATTHKEIFDAVQYYADRRLTENCKTWSDTNGNSVGGTVHTLALTYVITEEQKYLDKAKECLLVNADASKWPTWDATNTRDLYLADMLMRNAQAYDWLYNDLTESERDKVRASLARHATEMFEAAEYGNVNWSTWWPRSFIQNHRTTNNAALGVAALAIEDEPGYHARWLELAREQFTIEKYLLSQIDDGTWHEGFNYQNAVFSPTLPFYINLERLKGENLLSENYARNYVKWKTYNYLPDAEYPVFQIQSIVPDWGWNAGLHHVPLRYFAARFDDGHAEFAAQQILEESTRDRYKGNHAPNMVYEFLYYDADVSAKVPTDLPLDAYFPDMGIVTWRTGWEDDDITFGFKSSKYGGDWASKAYFQKEYPFDMEGSNANVGHNHADANTFSIYLGGTDLTSEKPHRQTWDQSKSWPMTSWHNTVVVDGKNQFMFHQQGLVGHAVGGKVNSVNVFDELNYLSADATDIYRNANSNWEPLELYIDEFTRRVVFIKPNSLTTGIFIILDNLRSDTAHKYEFVAQIGPSPTTTTNHITVQDDWVKGQVDGKFIGINVLSPEGFQYSKGISAVPDSNQDYDKANIKISPPTDVKDTRFITVLYPSTDWATRPESKLLEETGTGASVRVAYTDLIFRYNSKGIVEVGNYSMDADFVSLDATTIVIINGSHLERNGQILYHSDDLNTFQIEYNIDNINITGRAKNMIFEGAGYDTVYLNGEEISFTTSGSMIMIGDTCMDNNDLLLSIGQWKKGNLGLKSILQMISMWKNC